MVPVAPELPFRSGVKNRGAAFQNFKQPVRFSALLPEGGVKQSVERKLRVSKCGGIGGLGGIGGIGGGHDFGGWHFGRNPRSQNGTGCQEGKGFFFGKMGENRKDPQRRPRRNDRAMRLVLLP